MRGRLCAGLSILGLLAGLGALAQNQPTSVLVSDHGERRYVIGSGAPAHTVGLQGLEHGVSLDTGKVTYGLRYVTALDPANPQAAIPGEGYIGMPDPSVCNWYHGGFFDLVINGVSVGKTLLHSLTTRSSGDRGTADFVFDTPQAVVRIRFLARPGGDCLYTQTLLEPKVEIKSLRLVLRCYPSAFVSDADRHVLTPTRDLKQGEHAELDTANEWWLLYYDSIFDQGHVGASATSGVGPCSVLWPANQVAQGGLTVGAYGTDTTLTLKPQLRDFRFVFFDYHGIRNAVAQASLKARAPELLRELATLSFTDPTVANWPLAQKIAEAKRMLALTPEDKTTAARYEQWAHALAGQLKLMNAASTGGIMAEAEAASVIEQWEQGLPALKLQALLQEI